MLNDVALTACGLLSVTLILTVLVLGPCDSSGVQLMAPVGSTVRFDGPETSANVNEFAGISASVAVACAEYAASSLMLVFGGRNKFGATFTSLTIIW